MKNIKSILFIISLAACMRSESQTFQEVKASRVVVGSVLRPNRDTIQLNARDSGTIAYKNGDLYTWTGYLWKAVGVTGGGDNIYNSNGSLTSGRTVNGGNYPFSLTTKAWLTFVAEGVAGNWDNFVGDFTGIMLNSSSIQTRAKQDASGYTLFDLTSIGIYGSNSGDPDFWNYSSFAITKDSVHFKNTAHIYNFWQLPSYDTSAGSRPVSYDPATGSLHAGKVPVRSSVFLGNGTADVAISGNYDTYILSDLTTPGVNRGLNLALYASQPVMDGTIIRVINRNNSGTYKWYYQNGSVIEPGGGDVIEITNTNVQTLMYYSQVGEGVWFLISYAYAF